MSLLLYRKSLISWKALKLFLSSFFSAFGFIALPLGVADILFPNTLGFGFTGQIVILVFSLFWAAYRIWPTFNLERSFSVPDIKVRIRLGDLLTAKENVVIGMSDTFDTEKGEIIKPETIQGQFLTKVYSDDQKRLDTALESALANESKYDDKGKHRGKKSRYKIGTVAVLDDGGNKYFCLAYSKMDNKFRAQSSIKMLSQSLESLWEALIEKGQNRGVSLAVIGSDTARVGNVASYADLIKLIVTSFVITSREKLIAPSLTIYIYPKDREKINILEIKDYLNSF